MKFGTRLLGAKLVATLILLVGAVYAASQSWQASADYSSVQGHNDWRYMTYVPDGGGGPGSYEPMVYGQNFYGFDSWHNAQLYGDFIVGPIMHPSGLETARVWESPFAGTVRVTGSAAKGDPGGGDGVYVTIWKNGSLLWDATIAYNDVVGSSYDLPVSVKPGDWLIFRVHRIGDQNWDSTVFDPRITVTSVDSSGQAFDLAGNWNLSSNPNGAWAYGRMDGSLNFTPFSATIDAAYLGDFFGEQPSWDGGYPMVLGKSTGTCFHDFPLDRIGGHTANENSAYMAVRWTAPASGTYDISGGAWMFREIGRAAVLSLYINGVALFDDVLIPARSSGITSGATFSLGAAMAADGHSAAELLQIALEAGDTVTLAVRKSASSDYGDFVGLDLSVESTETNWIADVLAQFSEYVAGLDLSLFAGQNNHARSGRRLTLSHELQVASNRVASGETNAAINLLLNVIVRLQGASPPDWMADSPEKTALREDIWALIDLLRAP
jgi:hypothetical protein